MIEVMSKDMSTTQKSEDRTITSLSNNNTLWHVDVFILLKLESIKNASVTIFRDLPQREAYNITYLRELREVLVLTGEPVPLIGGVL